MIARGVRLQADFFQPAEAGPHVSGVTHDGLNAVNQRAVDGVWLDQERR
jgi:hypothetical protein